MNQKLFASKLALSAVLLCSIASPAMASASEQKQINLESSQTIALTKSTATSAAFSVISTNSIANPLELAKTYAPNTVTEWKSTLEKYEKLTGLQVTTEYSSDQKLLTKKIETGSTVNSNSDFEISMAIEAIPAIAEGSPEGKSETINIMVSDIEGSDTVHTITATTAVVAFDTALLNSEINLAKAVESKDSAAIKQSLNKLLEQYKLEITKLETKK